MPDYKKYDFKKDFFELYNNNEVFAQVKFVNRTDIKDRYNYYEAMVEMNTTIEDAKKLRKEMEEYHKALKKALEEIVGAELPKFDHFDFWYFNRIGDDIGICHFTAFERDKIKEEKEEEERREEHLRLLKEDPNYRNECEWFEKEYRPCGGAFNSIEDYYAFRGIKPDKIG